MADFVSLLIINVLVKNILSLVKIPVEKHIYVERFQWIIQQSQITLQSSSIPA